MQKLSIGLFGFGCVGQGLYFAINNSTGFKTSIKKIIVKNKSKERTIGKENFFYDKWDVLLDDSINVIVELIDDTDEAYAIVTEAIKRGKHVVTANKKMLALHLEELLALKDQYNVSLLYEAAACGSIPIIRTLEEYFDNEALVKISGIFNGTTNYILTKTVNDGISYEEALKNAQASGFAESDPTNDVEGFDALFKTTIIALHGFGVIIKPDEILRFGITTLKQQDIDYASRNGYKIKLVPAVSKLDNGKINAFVIPKLTTDKSHLYKVENEFNGVIVEGLFSGEQFFLGRGAGSHPTGAAVLSDISALSYGYSYENKKLMQQEKLVFTNEVSIKIFVSSDTKISLDKIPLTNIEESFETKDYFYRIGEVNVTELKLILENKVRGEVFIAYF